MQNVLHKFFQKLGLHPVTVFIVLAFAAGLTSAEVYAAAPVTVAGSAPTNEDTSATVDLTAYASDADGQVLTYYKSNAAYCTCSVTTAGVATIRPLANYTGTGAFCRFYVKDSGGISSNISRLSLTITAVNDAPRATNQTTRVTEDITQTITLVATDVDTTVASLSYTIVRRSAGTLGTVSGNSISYTTSANSTAPDSFTYKVYDGALWSNTATVSLPVTAVNDAPTAGNGTVELDEDGILPIALTATDIESNLLTYELVDSPEHGRAELLGGTATYIPNPNSGDDDSFTFRVYETATPTSISNTATISITVNDVNDAPTAVDDALNATEDTEVIYTPVQLIGNDMDLELNALAIESVTSGTGGTARLNADGTVTFTPGENFNGAASFTYTANEIETPTLVSNTATVTVTVIEENDTPVAVDDALEATEDTEVIYTAAQLIGNDTDEENNALAIESVTSGTGGTALLNADGTVTFTPSENFNGAASFSYTLSDGASENSTSNSAIVTVTVAEDNDAPVAVDDALDATEDTEVIYTAIQLTGNDTDEEDSALTIESVTSGTGGTARLNADGTVTFTPSENFNGAASFSYTLSDGASENSTSNSATVTVTVVEDNDAPTMSAVEQTTAEDTALTFTLAGTDVDDGDSLTYSIVTEPSATEGAVSLTGDQLTFTPFLNYSGTSEFSIKANDGAEDSSPATVTMTITADPNRPTATAGSATVGEDALTSIRLYGTCPTGHSCTYSVVGTSSANGGTITTPIVLSSSFRFTTYRGATNFYGADSFSFIMTDTTNGNISAPATVSVTVTAANDTPTMTATADQTTNENTPVVFTLVGQDVDVENTLHFYIYQNSTYSTSSTVASRGSLSLSGDHNEIATFTPEENRSGAATFSVRAYDGTVYSSSDSFYITINPNNAPTAEDYSTSTEQGVPIALALVASDVDVGDTLEYSFGTPAGGAVSRDEASGVTTYTPSADYSGTDTFTYTVSDGTLSASANATVTVVPLNAVPVATDASLTTLEETSVTTTLAATDAEGDNLTYQIASEASNGDVTIVDNEATYLPEENFHGDDAFTFTASDATGSSAAATVTVTVTNVNDVPVAENITAEMAENTTTTISLTATDGDADNLAYRIVESEEGSAEVSENEMTFTPSPDFDGTATVLYEVTDGRSSSNTGTVTVTVTGVNSAPVATDLALTTNEDLATGIALTATDPENQSLSFSVSQPSHGSAIVVGDIVTYTPEPDFYGTDSLTFTASDGTNTSNSAILTLTVNAISDPVTDCAAEVDISHLQTHTDTATGTEIKFYDNILLIAMARAATDEELDEIKTTAGGTNVLCRVEQAAFTDEEFAGMSAPRPSGYAYYLIQVPEQSDLAGLNAIADNVSALAYVTSALPSFFGFEELHAAETDIEAGASPLAIENAYFRVPQLQGALEYLRAYQRQGKSFSSVALSIADTGVCADSGCSVTAEFANFTSSGGNHLGTLAAVQPNYAALGLYDIDSPGHHGTDVASLMTAASNGDTSTSDPLTGLSSYPYSGILGSVYGLAYTLKSYLHPMLSEPYDYYNFSTPNPNAIQDTLQSMCNNSVIANESIGLTYAIISSDSANQAAQLKQFDIRRQVIEHCPQTLFITTAGNDSKNLSTETAFASFVERKIQSVSGLSVGNSALVVATSNGSDTISSVSNFGGVTRIAAPGYWTSYAAPIIAGTAGLIKAVNSAAAPEDILDLIETTGRKIDDLSYLDIAGAVLTEIKNRFSGFVPLSIRSLKFRNTNADLSRIRADEGYTTGTHTEEGLWELTSGVLTVKRDSVQESIEGGPQPYQEWLDADPNSSNFVENENSSIDSRLTTTNRYLIGLTTVTDSSSANRTIPVLTALPQGQQTVKLEGKFASGGYDSDVPNGYDPERFTNSPDIGVSYSFQLDYTANHSETNADRGFRVLLGRESESNGYTVPYDISQAELHGTAVVYAFLIGDNTCGHCVVPADSISSGSWNYSWVGNSDPINKAEVTLDNMELPDGDSFPLGSGTSTMEEFDTLQFDYHGASVGLGTSSIYYDDLAYLFYDIDVTFSDFSCPGVQANSSSTGSDSVANDVRIASDDLTLQTFIHTISVAGGSSSTCTVTANYTVTATVNREYNFYTFNNSETWTFSETIAWDLTDGVFPVPEVFSFIKMDKPTEHMLNSDYLTYPYFGDNSILPANMIHGGLVLPSIGIDDRTFKWAHGVGPLGQSGSTSNGRTFEVTDVDKPSRAVR